MTRGLRVWRVVIPALRGAACAPGSTAPTTSAPLEVREGFATYYGKEFHGRTTASGARFDMQQLVAAHPSYPFGTVLRVTNLTTGRSVRVRVVDRGPAAGAQAAGILIDLSYKAADTLRFVREGRTRVRLEVLRWGT